MLKRPRSVWPRKETEDELLKWTEESSLSPNRRFNALSSKIFKFNFEDLDDDCRREGEKTFFPRHECS